MQISHYSLKFLSQTKATKTIFMIKDKKIEPLLDESGSKNLFDQINKLWIDPEYQNRLKKGTVDENFRIDRCMVKFPKKGPIIVNFNQEVSWMAVVRKDHNTAFKKDDPVHLHQINDLLYYLLKVSALYHSV